MGTDDVRSINGGRVSGVKLKKVVLSKFVGLSKPPQR